MNDYFVMLQIYNEIQEELISSFKKVSIYVLKHFFNLTLRIPQFFMLKLLGKKNPVSGVCKKNGQYQVWKGNGGVWCKDCKNIGDIRKARKSFWGFNEPTRKYFLKWK